MDKIVPGTTINNKLGIYIEVPCWEWIIDTNQIYAFSYEHCSYYSRYSIEHIMKSHNFHTRNVSYAFDNEYLQYYGEYGANSRMSGAPTHAEAKSKETILGKTELFKHKLPILLEDLKKKLASTSDSAVLWGAAGKGTTLLNILDIGYERLKYVVDINPARHKTYIPRTGQQVVSPEFLKELKPKYILITNYNYYDEISSQILKLGVHADIISIDKLLKDETLIT